MSIHIAKGMVQVKRFDHEGLHQLQNSFVTDEDPRGQNVLLEPSARQRSMSLYHIINVWFICHRRRKV